MLLVSEINDDIKTTAAKTTEGASRSLGSINDVRSELPAITHVDFSARVQTVSDSRNRPFAELLRSFRDKTGCSVLVNTSFNVRGEPIVCTPSDAYTCFMRTQIDVLALGPFVLQRKLQPEFKEDADWRDLIPLD